ncbi:hypothetical protein [Cyanobium sp. ATX-6F1]|uniref:hypothetical protein n=1 Tax=Cyanobium sp. ATX-6F1 TaxID=3137388 RepID=UPI0039BE1216
MPPLAPPLSTALALLMVVTVLALVAWALQLMQAANDRKEFALMLAGCMVCFAAVGLATVMVITLSGPHGLLAARPLVWPATAKLGSVSMRSPCRGIKWPLIKGPREQRSGWPLQRPDR